MSEKYYNKEAMDEIYRMPYLYGSTASVCGWDTITKYSPKPKNYFRCGYCGRLNREDMTNCEGCGAIL